MKDKYMREPTQMTPLLSIQHMPDEVNFPELIDACKNEMMHARKNNPAENHSSVELLFMATEYNDSRAWEGIKVCFEQLVRGWLSRHPQKDAALRIKSEQHYMTLAFEEFRRVTISERMRFPTLLAGLRCLFLCLNGVIQSALRTNAARDYTLTLLAQTTDTITAGELMTIVQNLLTSERERRLAYLIFHCGLQPDEIVRDCPEEFSDLQEVTMLRCSIMLSLLSKLGQFQHLP
jgi:hypothetical protein